MTSLSPLRNSNPIVPVTPNQQTKTKKNSPKRDVCPWESQTQAYVPNVLVVTPLHLRAKKLSSKARQEFHQFLQRPLDYSLFINLRLQPTDRLFSKLRADIQDHCETRIQLFFMQGLTGITQNIGP